MPPSSTRAKVVLAGGLIAAVALLGVYFVWGSQGKPHPLTLYGNVDIREVNLGFRVAGRLATLSADEGDTVRAGQELGRLDSEPIQRELREASAALDALQARLQLLKAGYRTEDVEQARATLAERRAALTNAEQALARQKEMRGTGATSQRNLDDAQAARDEALARVNAAATALSQYQRGYRKEEIAEAQANAAKAESSLAQSQLRLDDTVLKSPSAGVILTRAVEPGAVLTNGATVFTLSLSQPVWVRAYVGEPDLGTAVPGSQVEILTDSNPSRPYHGRIGYVSPTAEFTPKNVETTDLRTALVYRLRIVVSDADSGLRQGMPVTVKLASARS
jgi:HlyD family secretion protein